MSATASELEAGACAACGPGREASLWLTNGAWRYRECLGCGSLFLDPRPVASAAAEQYQSPEYFGSRETTDRGYTTYREDGERYEATYIDRLSRLTPPRPGAARLLDVGCGYGYALRAAQRLGWDAWGADISAEALRASREVDGAHVLGMDEALARPEGFYHAVSMFDVLEHLNDPGAMLSALRRVMAPGGELIITTPRRDSLLARVSGKKWISLKPPEHVQLYSRAALMSVVSRHFEVREARAARQRVSLRFAADRAAKSWSWARPAAWAVDAVPGAGDLGIWADSGSITLIARRSIG